MGRPSSISVPHYEDQQQASSTSFVPLEDSQPAKRQSPSAASETSFVTLEAPPMAAAENSTSSSHLNLSSSNNNSNSHLNNDPMEIASTTTHHESTWYFVVHEIKSLIPDLIDYIRNKPLKKKLLTMTVVLSSALVFFDLLFLGNIHRWLTGFVVWMTENPNLAVGAFVGIFVVATLVFIPPTFLYFGAGYAFEQSTQHFGFGILLATLTCFVGCFLGALLAFLRARYMMRDLIYLFSNRYPLVRAADKALKRNGFRVMLLLRLCPLIPFSALNYIGGITGISAGEYAASTIGILPWILLTVVVGATAGNFTSDAVWTPTQSLVYIILICAGLAFVLIALVLVWRFAKKELESELEMDSQQMSIYLHHPQEAVQQQHADEVEESGIEAHYTGEDETTEEWFWLFS